MTQIACCIWGNKKPNDSDLSYLQNFFHELIDSLNCEFFVNTDHDIFYSLWLVNNDKKNVEIQKNSQFDCVWYINCEYIDQIANCDYKLPLANTVYYLDGGFNRRINSTYVNPWVFYSDSLSGDRASIFTFNTTWDSEKYYFYNHLKSWGLQSEYINKDKKLFGIIS